MSSSPEYQTPLVDCSKVTQNLLTTLLTSLPAPCLWILVSTVISMTILRYTLLPCLTLRGLEETIKAVDKMLQGHIGLGIIPSNVDSGAGSNFCFAPGLDYSEHLLCSDQLGYLDIGDLEDSRRCMDYEERLCRIKDIAHDLRLQPPPPSLIRYLKVYITRICTISSAYKEVHKLRHEIKHLTLLISKRHNKFKLDFVLLRKQRSTCPQNIMEHQSVRGYQISYPK
ncbi:hypothetical protein BDP27DRAFT_1406783 [Rhodocollybia butyracea]|uniref:Uncharacterized protein n=1 Tax=Rhodocollybia butyracea TaxID=206335 RepID=A0A9P5P958_9AGAR|nr:hypothetical protein BDP27DRAFT_1406783 [Rhodocollybia butyracea]